MSSTIIRLGLTILTNLFRIFVLKASIIEVHYGFKIGSREKSASQLVPRDFGFEAE